MFVESTATLFSVEKTRYFLAPWPCTSSCKLACWLSRSLWIPRMAIDVHRLPTYHD